MDSINSHPILVNERIERNRLKVENAKESFRINPARKRKAQSHQRMLFNCKCRLAVVFVVEYFEWKLSINFYIVNVLVN